MSHVTYLSAALLAFWGISWFQGLFSFSPPCTGFHYRTRDVIIALLALPGQEKHIIIMEVLQCSLPGKWLGLGVAFSLCRLPLYARSLLEESWKMKTSNTVEIQWHSSLQSSQSGPEKQVSTYFGPNKDWTMGGCVQNLFSYPICRHYPKDLHSHEDNAQGLSSCLNYSSLYLRPPLIFFLAF